MVCHKKWFVDPITKIHTQSIEAFWSVFKRWVRKRGYNIGPAEETLSYIGEFLWCREGQSFEQFCYFVAKFGSCEANGQGGRIHILKGHKFDSY